MVVVNQTFLDRFKFTASIIKPAYWFPTDLGILEIILTVDSFKLDTLF